MANIILYGTAIDGKKYAIRCTTAGELSIDDTANPLGSSGNLFTSAIWTNATFSTPFETNNLYKNCILSYVDQSPGSTRPITLWGSTTTSGGAYIYLGSITPTVIRNGLRFGSLNINLGSVKWVKIYNEETLNPFSSVVATLLSF